MTMSLATLTLAVALGVQPGDAPSLVGPTWAAVELAGMAVAAEPAARQPTLEFVANRRVAGTDGCTRFSGPYTHDGERLTFGDAAMTRMACPGTEEISGPFPDLNRAQTEWTRLSFRDHLGATTRYVITQESMRG